LKRLASAPGIRVRTASPRDARALVDLAHEVGAEPEGWLISEGEWRSVRDERRQLAAARRSRDVAVIVAENDGEIVGRLSIVRDLHPACAHVADLGLMVAREHRREGVGTALLAAAESWARDVGVRKLELSVFPHNAPALALYRRCGFREEGLRAAHFRRGDRYVDSILMAKDLSQC
jgi:RimJ/RimL family protein N-acetyltransferase